MTAKSSPRCAGDSVVVAGDSVVVFSFVIFKLRCIARAKRRGDLTSTRAAQRLAIKNFMLGPQS